MSRDVTISEHGPAMATAEHDRSSTIMLTVVTPRGGGCVEVDVLDIPDVRRVLLDAYHELVGPCGHCSLCERGATPFVRDGRCRQAKSDGLARGARCILDEHGPDTEHVF